MTKTSLTQPSPSTAPLTQVDPEFFKALGDPMRLALVGYMAQLGKPSSVTEVSSCCGIDFSGVSRHLKVLRDAGIVSAEKRGRETFYKLNVESLATTFRALSDMLEGLPKQ